MRKYLLLTLIVLYSVQLFGEETVRVRSDIDLVVTGLTSTTIPVTADLVKTDPTTEVNAKKIYLPMQSTSLATNKYFIATVASVFDATNTSHVAYIPLRVSTPASFDRYLWAAVKDTTDGNKYKPFKVYGSGPLAQGGTNQDLVFSLSPADLCLKFTTTTECDSIKPAAITGTEKIATVYFFLSSQAAYGASDYIDPATAPLNNGIYFSVSMSNRVYSSTDLLITINSTKVGDKRLVLDYTASNTLSTSTAKAVRAFKHAGTPSSTNQPIYNYTVAGGGVGGTLMPEEYPYAQNSTVTVSGLTNNELTTLSLAFIDKYNFLTNLSRDVSGTPLEIQELLKKEGCFLLTAGFGEEHFVIEYFRHFRDTILSKSYLGRQFIHFYYELAPKYALMLYQHESLRAMVRGAAYVLYFIFNYAVFIALFVLMGTSSVYFYKKREKIKT